MSGGTPEPSLASRSQKDAFAPPEEERIGESASLVGVAGSRFVVLDDEETTLVVDLKERHSFRVFGRAVRDEVGGEGGATTPGWFTAEAYQRLAASADGTRLLVETHAGFQLVDLDRRGAFVTGVESDAEHAAIAADGKNFAVWSDRAITVVRSSDGARLTHAGGPSTPSFANGFVTWTSKDAAHVVDGETLAHRETDGPGGAIANSEIVVTWTTRIIEIRKTVASPAVARFASASIGSVVVDAGGKSLAWAEVNDEAGKPIGIHTFDVTNRVHARFMSKGGPCEIDGEWLEQIAGSTLRTSDTCSPGCPSLAYTPSYIEYDIHSGTVLRRFEGETSPPELEEESARQVAVEKIAATLNLNATDGRFPLVGDRTSKTFVSEDQHGLRRVGRNGEAAIALEGSEGLTLSSVTFSIDGSMIVARTKTGVAAWNAQTGLRL